jgi:hypothetical protein
LSFPKEKKPLSALATMEASTQTTEPLMSTEEVYALFDRLHETDPVAFASLWLPRGWLESREMVMEEDKAVGPWDPGFGKPVLRPMSTKERMLLRVRRRKEAEAAAAAAGAGRPSSEPSNPLPTLDAAVQALDVSDEKTPE